MRQSTVSHSASQSPTASRPSSIPTAISSAADREAQCLPELIPQEQPRTKLATPGLMDGPHCFPEPAPVTEAFGRDPCLVAREHTDKLAAWLTRLAQWRSRGSATDVCGPQCGKGHAHTQARPVEANTGLRAGSQERTLSDSEVIGSEAWKQRLREVVGGHWPLALSTLLLDLKAEQEVGGFGFSPISLHCEAAIYLAQCVDQWLGQPYGIFGFRGTSRDEYAEESKQ